MMRQLYEVAVLTPVTSRPGNKNNLDVQDVFPSRDSSSLSSTQDVSQHINHQLDAHRYLLQGDALWATETGQVHGKTWASVADFGGFNQGADGQMWYTEDAQSASSYSLQGSISSWDIGREIYSSETLSSRDSIIELTNQQNSSSAACSNVPPRQKGVIGVEFNSEPSVVSDTMSLFIESGDTANISNKGNETGHCAVPRVVHSNETMSDAHLEQTLVRVALDLSALDVQVREGKLQQFPLTPSCNAMYEDQRSSKENMSTGVAFQSITMDDLNRSQLFGFEREIDVYKAVICEADHHGYSTLDSGQVSISSSLSSLSGSSSNASEENHADVESCENLGQLRTRKVKRKFKNSTSAPNVVFKPQLLSINESHERMLDNWSIGNNLNILYGGDEVDSIKSTSCFSDSPASHSLSSDSEISELNPYSKPFVPRTCSNANISNHKTTPAMHVYTKSQGHEYYQSDLSTNSINACKMSNHGFQFGDSGLGNTVNLTGTWNTSDNTRNTVPLRSSNNRNFLSETSLLSSMGDNMSFTRNYHFKDNPISYVNAPKREEISPYVCKLDHGSEFTPLQDLTAHILPNGYQTDSAIETIKAISQRVVKLRVSKTFKMALNPTQDGDFGLEEKPNFMKASDPDVEGPDFDHYGTGFACHVDKDCLVIRTHSEVVGSSLEASSTEVVFVISLPDGIHSQMIRCTGQAEGFRSSPHSQTTKFMCKTPPELIPLLHLFKNVPVVRRASLFHDSCYFTDSSPDTSSSERDDFEKNLKQTPFHADGCKQVGINAKLDLARKFEITPYALPANGDTGRLELRVLQTQIENPDCHIRPQLSSHYNADLINNDFRTAKFDLNSDYHVEKQTFIPHHYNTKIPDKFKADDIYLSAGVNFSEAQLALNASIIARDKQFTNTTTSKMFFRQSFESADTERRCPPGPNFSNHPRRSLDKVQLDDLPGIPHIHKIQHSFTSVSSPLVIMERNYESLNKASDTKNCPYAGQNTFGDNGIYSSFSSFAGDVFSSYVAPGVSPPLTGQPQDMGKWEYERLIHAQSHHRDAYNRLNKTAPFADNLGAVGAERLHKVHICPSYRKLSVQGAHSSIAKSDGGAKNLFNDNCTKTESAHEDSSTPVEHVKSGLKIDSCFIEPRRFDTFRSAEDSESSCSACKLSQGSSIDLCPTSGTDINDTVKRGLFSDFSSLGSYLDTWDRDLLNLDEELNPLPELDHMETMVSNLLDDCSDEDCGLGTDLTSACCPRWNLSKRNSNEHFDASEKNSSYCLIMSYPHGGPKIISTGIFSRHHHVGGILYDTPTCMGSCGAPVIALTEDVRTPYVTHYVHSGTVKVNNVIAGAGLVYFDQPLPTVF